MPWEGVTGLVGGRAGMDLSHSAASTDLPPSFSGLGSAIGRSSSAQAEEAPAIIARAGTVFTNVLRSMEQPLFCLNVYRYAEFNRKVFDEAMRVESSVVLAVPDGRVEAVPGPGGIEIGAGAVAQLMKSRAVHVDDKDRAFPVDGDGIVLGAAETATVAPACVASLRKLRRVSCSFCRQRSSTAG